MYKKNEINPRFLILLCTFNKLILYIPSSRFWNMYCSSSSWNLLLLHESYKIAIMQVFRFLQWCRRVSIVLEYDALSAGSCFVAFWAVVARYWLHHPYIFSCICFCLSFFLDLATLEYETSLLSQSVKSLLASDGSVVSHNDRNLSKFQSVEKSTEIRSCH
jgi:hypothetical protein